MLTDCHARAKSFTFQPMKFRGREVQRESGNEGSSHLSKVTQPMRGRTGFELEACTPNLHCFNELMHHGLTEPCGPRTPGPARAGRGAPGWGGGCSPVSQGCDHEPPAVAQVLIAVDELSIHSPDVQIIIYPIVPGIEGR